MDTPYLFLEKTDTEATLTTWVYCAMWQLYAAENYGLKAYINWPQGRERSRRFESTGLAERPRERDLGPEFMTLVFEDPFDILMHTFLTPRAK